MTLRSHKLEPNVRLEIELVPTPLWGESLYRLLSSTQWNKIRMPVLERAAGRCEVCGAAGARLICHEQWNYQDEIGHRTLMGIEAVCGPCNSVMHIGRAGIIAAEGGLDLQEVYDHFMKVNGIDWASAQKAMDDAFAVHARRSKRKWTTDFGPHAEAVNARK